MKHVKRATTKKFRELQRKLELILVMGWGWELNSMRSNLLLFLSSSVVERSAVSRLVTSKKSQMYYSTASLMRSSILQEVTIAASKDIIEKGALPFWAVVGGGIRAPDTPWFCSPRAQSSELQAPPISTGFVPESTLKGTFPSPQPFRS
ncbi:hypothetical protein HAX54_014974 [Datura stramonium]|uniref:Uncharacterized protein n=1 Tax=Datura stramonium TaxID=4076 RepID=A0ABS8TNV7_DATST|nr:hypothetical protein [Datura stramonium]